MYGATGIGKSRMTTFMVEKFSDMWVAMTNFKWFDGYNG